MSQALRRFLLAVTAIFALSIGVAQAETAAPAAADSAVNTPAGKFIQNLGDHAIAILADKNLPAQARNTQFRAMLHDSFDLNTIGKFVLGRNNWQAATPAQQKDYLDLFETLVVKTYADRFALYTGEGFKVRTARAEGDADTVVGSEITHPDGSPGTTVEWRVRQRDNGKLGILDVVVEGVSMSVTQRQEYAAIIQRDGGKIDGLLSTMRQRAQDNAPVAQPK